MRRDVMVCAALAALAIAAACEGEDKKKEGGGHSEGLVTESDTVQCGSGATLLENHTSGSYRVHVRLSSTCRSQSIDDSLPPRPARIYAADSAGIPVPGQSVDLKLGDPTKRGVLEVPAKGSLRVACEASRIEKHGCQWSYSYSP